MKIQENFTGSKQSFFGPADYAEVQFQQKNKPISTQSMSVGASKEKPTIEGYEKTVHTLSGTKQTLMGAASVSMAQSFQSWSDSTLEETPKEDIEVPAHTEIESEQESSF